MWDTPIGRNRFDKPESMCYHGNAQMKMIHLPIGGT